MIGVSPRIIAIQVAADHLQVADALKLGQVVANSRMQQRGIELALIELHFQLPERHALVRLIGVVDKVFRMVTLFLVLLPGAVLAQVPVPGSLGVAGRWRARIAGLKVREQTVEVVLQAADGLVERGGAHLAADADIGQAIARKVIKGGDAGFELGR
ncbi:hypothetical protein D3C77_570260 [compost metagenome]